MAPDESSKHFSGDSSASVSGTETRTVLFAAGGTGGHVFPACAVAEWMQSRGWRVALCTDERMEGRVKYQHPQLQCVRVDASSFTGGMLRKIKAGFTNLRGIFQALRIIRRWGPDIVVGFGGYSSAPVLMAARLCHIPIVLHEQNAYLGRTRRYFLPYADLLATGFVKTFGLPTTPRGKTWPLCHTGVPVRQEFTKFMEQGAPYPALDPEHVFSLLVLGGTQGARLFSDVLPASLDRLPIAMRARIQLVQQCRPDLMAALEQRYRQMGVQATLSPFIEDAAGEVAKAHLVISRSGASTVTELRVAKRPAILVPFPGALDDHQSHNAMAFVKEERGWCFLESEFTPERVSEQLKMLMEDSALLNHMVTRMTPPWEQDPAVLLGQKLAEIAECKVFSKHSGDRLPTAQAQTEHKLNERW